MRSADAVFDSRASNAPEAKRSRLLTNVTTISRDRDFADAGSFPHDEPFFFLFFFEKSSVFKSNYLKLTLIISSSTLISGFVFFNRGSIVESVIKSEAECCCYWEESLAKTDL